MKYSTSHRFTEATFGKNSKTLQSYEVVRKTYISKSLDLPPPLPGCKSVTTRFGDLKKKNSKTSPGKNPRKGTVVLQPSLRLYVLVLSGENCDNQQLFGCWVCSLVGDSSWYSSSQWKTGRLEVELVLQTVIFHWTMTWVCDSSMLEKSSKHYSPKLWFNHV